MHRTPFWLLLTTLCITLGEAGGFAQSANRLIFKQPQAQDPVPGSVLGRGTRNPGDRLCGQPEVPLAALAPRLLGTTNTTNSTPDQVLGLTRSATPTLWFYLPYTTQSQLTAELELRELVNGDLQRVSQQTVSITAQPGLLPVRLALPGLQSGKKYQWVFAVKCIPSDASADDIVSGWVERVPPASGSSRPSASLSVAQKVQAYAQAGLWHETLTTVVGELCQRDRAQAQRWFADLMQSANLRSMPQYPNSSVLQSCPKL